MVMVLVTLVVMIVMVVMWASFRGGRGMMMADGDWWGTCAGQGNDCREVVGARRGRRGRRAGGHLLGEICGLVARDLGELSVGLRELEVRPETRAGGAGHESPPAKAMGVEVDVVGVGEGPVHRGPRGTNDPKCSREATLYADRSSRLRARGSPTGDVGRSGATPHSIEAQTRELKSGGTHISLFLDRI